MSALLQLPTPIEVHEGVHVKRDDLVSDAMPSGKLRGVLPLFAALRAQGHDLVVNAGASHSNSHALAAWAGREAGLRVLSVANTSDMSKPNLLEAERLGATVVHAGPSHLSVLRARARVVAARANGYLLPWAFLDPRVATGIADAVREVAPLSRGRWVHVVPVGSGAYLSGIVHGLQRLGRTDEVVYGVAVMGLRPSLQKRIELLTWPAPNLQLVTAPLAYAVTPWPSDPHYEHRAWPLALELRAQGEHVLFWSVGRPA